MSWKEIVGDIVGVVYAVPTFGASLLLSPNARKLAKGILGVGGDDNNTLNQNMESWKIQNDQWKALVEANKAEVERLRKEREDADKEIKFKNDELDRVRAIINNPNSTEEERTNARKRMVVLENEIRKLKDKRNKIDKDIEDKSQTPPAPSKPWSWPKLSVMDKVIIAGGTVLIVYLIIPEKKR